MSDCMLISIISVLVEALKMSCAEAACTVSLGLGLED